MVGRRRNTANKWGKYACSYVSRYRIPFVCMNTSMDMYFCFAIRNTRIKLDFLFLL